jgi:DNA-binding LacI/PurR family transcriptional regulator
MTRVRKILLAVPDSVYGREVLRGVHDHRRTHGPWQLFLCLLSNTPTRQDNRRLASTLRTSRPDGILAAVRHSNLRLLQRCGVPIVNVSGIMRTSLPTVMADHVQIGRLAARSAPSPISPGRTEDAGPPAG